MPEEISPSPLSGFPSGYENLVVRRLLENLEGFAVFALDARGTVLGWTAGAERLFGHRGEEIQGSDAALFFPPEARAVGQPAASLAKALEAGRAEGFHWLTRKDGRRFPAAWIMLGMGANRETPPWILAIARDTTDGEILEEQMKVGEEQLAALSEFLRESDARFRSMIEAVEDAVFFVDRQGIILTWNRGARQHLGFSGGEIVGKGWCLLLSGKEEDRSEGDRCLALAEASGRARWEGQVVRKDGSRFWAEIAVTAIREEPAPLGGYCALIRDLTPSRAAEEALRDFGERLRQSQKMDAIGRLAGGVAHDFNNLLTAILGFSELGLGLAGKDHPVHPILEEIAKAGRTAAELTRNLLAVSRKQPLTPVIVDLSAMVDETAAMLRRILGADILVSTRLASPGAALVMADRGMVQQILLNLAVNAKDAMPEGGTLTVETRTLDLAEPMEGEQGRLPAGRYATLVVADTGTGMAEEVKAHLFEPFFTTKEKGKGTGLGLSTTYGVVRQSGGEIAVVSERGFGTAFFIHFPRVEGAAAENRRAASSGTAARAAGERVLVVDDEDMVRKFVVSVLENAGYRVRVAGSGREALDIWEKEGGRFDALLTDIVMPGLNGLDLADRLRVRDPGLRVVIMSGYPADVDMGEAMAKNDYLFQGKPFAPDAILKTLQEAFRPKTVP